MNIAITTARNQGEDLINKAQNIAKELEITYVERNKVNCNRAKALLQFTCL